MRDCRLTIPDARRHRRRKADRYTPSVLEVFEGNAKSSQLKISGTWSDGYNTGNLQSAFSAPPGPPPFAAGTLPNSTAYANWCPAYASDELISFHPGGGHVLMCDGSTHFLTPEMPVSLLWSLCSRNGDEPLGDRWAGD